MNAGPNVGHHAETAPSAAGTPPAPPPQPTPESLAPILLTERVAEHARAAAAAASGSLMAAAVTAWLVWPSSEPRRLALWCGLLVAALALRMLLAVRLKPTHRAPIEPRRALRWHRIAFVVHGLAWAVLPWWAMTSHASDLILALIGLALVGSSLNSTTHDLRASAGFCLPVALSYSTVVVRTGDPLAVEWLIASMAFLAMLTFSAWRNSAATPAAITARLEIKRRTEQAEQLARTADAARRALSDQHQLLQQLVRTTGQGYWHVDPNGQTLDANDAMCRMLGRTLEQLRGLNVYDIFQGEQRATLERELARRRNGSRSSYQIDVVRPDGSTIPCLNNATPILDSDGRSIGSVGLWTDLSEVKRQQRELLTYAVAVNAMPDAVAVLDVDLRHRLVNDAWTRLAGRDRETLLSQTLAQAAPSHLRNDDCARSIASCMASQRELVLRSRATDPADAAAPPRDLETRIQPFRDSATGLTGAIVSCRDVSEQESARRAIEQAAEHLRRTLNATGDAIFASDAAGPHEPVRFVNDQMLRMWNIPLEAAATLTPAEIMHHSLPLMVDPQAQAAHIAQIIASNRADESHVALQDGRIIFRRCEPAVQGAYPLRVWTFRDVTTQERAIALLNDREREQRALLETFPGFIARLDLSWRLTYVSPGLEQLLEQPASVLVGLHVLKLAPELTRAQLEAAQVRALAGERVVVERRHRTRRDEVDLQLTLARGVDPVSGAPAIHLFGIDITQRKRAEAQLSAARDEAQRANQAKTRFLSQMSHELRTPLNAIAGFSQLLLRDQRSTLPPQQRQWATQIRHGADHLLTLINEIVDLDRIEAGHVDIRHGAVDVGALVDECVALTSALARTNGISLHHAADGAAAASFTAMADRRRLKQVLLNLIGNAIKYNRPGGEVTVCVRERAPDASPAGQPAPTRGARGADADHSIRIEVTDTGPGLDAQQIARLFTPFERLGAERGDVEGSGIGLALCRQLVHAMGGDIGVDSRPGQGSTFWVRLEAAAPSGFLPLGTRPAALDGDDAEDAADAAPVVLYVDDKAVNLMLVQIMLGDWPGLRLLTTDRPEQALVLAREHLPDLVLTDIHMPGIDGFEMLRRLRAMPELVDVPVLAVSAHAMPHDIERAMKAGFADYLTKPLELDRIREVVDRWLAGAAGTGGRSPRAPARRRTSAHEDPAAR